MRLPGSGRAAQTGQLGIVGIWRSQPLPLRVDPVIHRAERDRFLSRVVRGPAEGDCAIYVGAISNDGYPVLRLRREEGVRVVRAARYALAAALEGVELGADVRALHECDNPACVLVVPSDETGHGVRLHVVGGDQRENMRRMARMGRGGGRPVIVARGAGRAARAMRSRAIREAVRHGWDAEAVTAALLGGGQATLW